jgi:hypothetical protein
MQKDIDTTAAKSESAKPLALVERIGQTTYMVTVHFSETSKESVKDKILILVEREAKNLA